MSFLFFLIDHCWPRNGPARTRRREKWAAAREKLAAEEAAKDVESTEDVDDTTTDDKPAAEEANGNVKSTDNEEPTDAGKVKVQEIKELAERATEPTEEATAGKVGLENIDDEFCTDAVYTSKSKETKSVASQTLERGPLPNSSSKPGFDYYTLRYDDISDWTPPAFRSDSFFHIVSYFSVQKHGVFCYFFEHNKDLKQQK